MRHSGDGGTVPWFRQRPHLMGLRLSLTGPDVNHNVDHIMSCYVIEREVMVRPEWIDSNGHMNLAYYVVVFDLATDALYDALGIGNAYREATGFSCFTAETHTLYEREVHVGDRLQVRAWLLSADAKRVHYFHEMFHAESGERAAVQELMALHIDMRVRRVAPFPPDRQAELVEAVRRYAPAELPRGAGRRIAIPSVTGGKIERAECRPETDEAECRGAPALAGGEPAGRTSDE